MHNIRFTKPFFGRTLAGLLATGASLTCASSASASGFLTARFGGEHGTPTTDNPTALYYNPAGLADRDPGVEKAPFEFHVFADANLAWVKNSFTHTQSKNDIAEPNGAKGANNGKATLTNFAAAPSIGVDFKIGDFAVGAGFFVPFGGQQNWDKNKKFENNKSFAGPYDGVQRWNVINGEIKSIYISVGAAYDIVKRVSIGASFNLVNSDVKQIRAREPGGTNDVDLEGRSFLDVSGFNGAFGLGVLGEVVPRKLWLGLSFQSQPGVAGDIVLKGTVQNNFAGSVTKPPGDKVKLFEQLPAVYRFGVRARPADKWEVRFSADLSDWGAFKGQCIAPDIATECVINKDGSAKDKNPKTAPIQNLVRNWGPAFGARLGGSYWVKEEIELFASLGYDSNAVPDATLEPALQDYHDFFPSIGGHFAIGKHFGVELSYTQFIYLSRDTSGKSTTASQAAPSKTPDGGGKYSQAIGVTQVAVDASF